MVVLVRVGLVKLEDDVSARDILSGFICLHVLPHARQGPFFGGAVWKKWAATATGRARRRSTSGPIAQLSSFLVACVARLGWVDDAYYTDLMALSQFLPEAASSQASMALRLIGAGLLGAYQPG